MNILAVTTNPDFITKDGGTTITRKKLVTLLSRNNNMVYLNALPRRIKGIKAPSDLQNGATARTYHFKQWFILGTCVPMLTDLNMAFLKKIKDVVKREKIDLIFITDPYGIVSASLLCRRIPIIYDAHDVVSDYAKIAYRRVEILYKIVRLPVIEQIARILFLNYISILERLACRRAKHIITLTEPDRQEFVRKYHLDKSKVTFIPVFVEVGGFERTPGKQESPVEGGKINIVFHGIYYHPANYEAFKLIEDYIAPEVKKCDDNIRFLLAGTDTPKFVKENIEYLGHVQDLSKLFEVCTIAIAPLLRSAGVNVKVLDYMAAGLPIITTKQVAKGIGLEHGKHAIILDTVDRNFVEAILGLARDKQKREALGRNALELVETEHNRQKIQSKLDQVLVMLKAG